MDSIIRVATAVNQVIPGNPRACLAGVERCLDKLWESAPDIVLFPQLALCSPSCGSLLDNAFLLEDVYACLQELCANTKNLDCYIIVGLPLSVDGKAVPATAVIHRGLLLGCLADDPAFVPPEQPGTGIWLPRNTTFVSGALRFCIHAGDPAALPAQMSRLPSGCDLVLVPAYQPVYAGYNERAWQAVEVVSRAYGCAIAVANGGVGDTSHPYIYRGFAWICECGERLSGQSGLREDFVIVSDLDCDIIHAKKTTAPKTAPFYATMPVTAKQGLLRPIYPEPYLIASDADAYLADLFDLQVASLAARMENIRCEKIVLGVSGGLDSTLAAIVGALALVRLGLPRHNFIGVTMPGFGTSDQTLWNALHLMEILGADVREIPIRASVQQHFEDIGHPMNLHNTTYENAQARERTQILMDIANTESALVVGTGDLSEMALGWSTFGGDHLAGYNVNACLTKTLVRLLVGHVGKSGVIEGIDELLREIWETPVSPELLPPTDSGKIAQKTEEILGPYELHDFFLFHLTQYHMRPSKIYRYACAAFGKTLDAAFIKEKLRLFLERFAFGQFKRSCSPDGAMITEFNLMGPAFWMPSDFSPNHLLSDLDTVE